jgi:hypothetical protein
LKHGTWRALAIKTSDPEGARKAHPYHPLVAARRWQRDRGSELVATELVATELVAVELVATELVATELMATELRWWRRS